MKHIKQFENVTDQVVMSKMEFKNKMKECFESGMAYKEFLNEGDQEDGSYSIPNFNEYFKSAFPYFESR